MVRGWRLGSLKEEAGREEWRFRNRNFSVFPDLDGSYVVKGRLTPEVGALPGSERGKRGWIRSSTRRVRGG